MPQETKAMPHDPDEQEVAPGVAHAQLEGWVPTLATPAETNAALEQAFGYRGDVTLTLKDGSQVEGYVFDRRVGKSLAESIVRLFPKDGNEKLSVRFDQIAALAFSGRDTAAGKSFETWVKKYREKKARGEPNIGIEAEGLD